MKDIYCDWSSSRIHTAVAGHDCTPLYCIRSDDINSETENTDIVV